jgi:hypothetical protein
MLLFLGEGEKRLMSFLSVGNNLSDGGWAYQIRPPLSDTRGLTIFIMGISGVIFKVWAPKWFVSIEAGELWSVNLSSIGGTWGAGSPVALVADLKSW